MASKSSFISSTFHSARAEQSKRAGDGKLLVFRQLLGIDAMLLGCEDHNITSTPPELAGVAIWVDQCEAVIKFF
jgi:hypothetical protein